MSHARGANPVFPPRLSPVRGPVAAGQRIPVRIPVPFPGGRQSIHFLGHALIQFGIIPLRAQKRSHAQQAEQHDQKQNSPPEVSDYRNERICHIYIPLSRGRLFYYQKVYSTFW